VQVPVGGRIPPASRIGDYVVVEELVVEETGVVYEGKHVLLPRRVLLKIMHAGSWSRAVAMAVLREACLLEALSHPGIPRVFECGVLPDKRPWTAFELIDGDPIGELQHPGPMAVAEVTAMLRDVSDLLAHAHGRGVVHRQLTAHTIVKTPERPFGYAVVSWENALTLDTRSVMLDTRDDVFALGVVAFRALTGALPDVQTTHEACPLAPVELCALIDNMLAIEPVARPTAVEIKERAQWLATLNEPIKARWTPPHGLDDKIPPMTDGFAIRISRTRSS
jgi:serine/threonine protein kinase